MSMDLVYVLGTGSRWGNRELRYSLRSVAKHLKDVGRIFVVGENPGFLSKDVVFIKLHELHDPQVNPAANIISKVLAACEAGVGEHFLLMNDDFLFTQDVMGYDIPLYHKGKFSEYPKKYFSESNYRLRMAKTFRILKANNIDAYNFGIHVPMPICKKDVVAMLGRYDWKSGVGISLRTVYGNLYADGKPLQQLKDPNVNEHLSREELDARADSLPFMAYNDQGLNRALRNWLHERFPSRSKYEATDIPADNRDMVVARRTRRPLHG